MEGRREGTNTLSSCSKAIVNNSLGTIPLFQTFTILTWLMVKHKSEREMYCLSSLWVEMGCEQRVDR